MSVEDLFQFVPVFVLVFFRTAGLMLSAPLFGSAKIPKRVKVMLALVLAAGLVNRVSAVPPMPGTLLELAAGLAGELIFGFLMGLGLSLAFIAITWAGEIIGQQMGMTLAETFDPQLDRKSTRLNSSHMSISYAVFCLEKKTRNDPLPEALHRTPDLHRHPRHHSRHHNHPNSRDRRLTPRGPSVLCPPSGWHPSALALRSAVVTPKFTAKALDTPTWGAFSELVECNSGVFCGCWCIGFHPLFF